MVILSLLENDVSTLLKSDQWLSESQRVLQSVRGVINFRSIPGTNIYACGQPTESAIHQVVQLVKEHHPNANKVIWVTLREEPIVYINGAPYCLRRERFSLRNMKGYRLSVHVDNVFTTFNADYGGISASRLEVLEERLKADVLAELNAFDGRYEIPMHASQQCYIRTPSKASTTHGNVRWICHSNLGRSAT